jgi:hypothetical protein
MVQPTLDPTAQMLATSLIPASILTVMVPTMSAELLTELVLITPRPPPLDHTAATWQTSSIPASTLIAMVLAMLVLPTVPTLALAQD